MFLNYLLRLISLNHSPKFLSYQKKKKLIELACLFPTTPATFFIKFLNTFFQVSFKLRHLVS